MRILVTGGSRGIGNSIVTHFKNMGHEVYAPDKNELDLSKDFKLEKNEFEILINNAGVNFIDDFINSDIENIMKVNFFSPHKIIKECLPYMIKIKYGRIINIGSILSIRSKIGRSAYSASKSALNSLTKSLSIEYGKYNILTNTISPGYVSTDLTYKNNTKKDIEHIISKIPINRLGKSEEIAELTYFLTINNNYINGQNIIIDGGYICTT